MSADNSGRPPFTYSCYFTRNREDEQFIPEHVFSYQLSGTLTLNNGVKDHIFNPGDFRFIKRNQLVKFIKQPAPGGSFQSISVYFDQEMLRNISMEYGFHADHQQTLPEPVIALNGDPLLHSFITSMDPYIKGNNLITPPLQLLKQREAVLILLQLNPGLKQILFDFHEPGKIDLEEFMHRNFHFNVQLNRFAYLTGRSLATFKRDFEKIFHTSPSKWLLQRRLQEAHYLISEKKKAPADVYLETGFEDLSHFSFAFKKQYGIPPSHLTAS